MEQYLIDANALHKVIMLIDMTAGLQDTDQSLLDILID